MSAATIDPGASKARRKHPDLIFEWVGSHGHRWRLLLFLNLSLALHVACFYAFQVVYPTTVRQRAETTKVTFLDPRDDAGVRDVISHIEGRKVFIDGSLRLTIPGTSLELDEANEVLPVPAFATREPALRLPPEIDASLELPRIFPAGEVFLPQRYRFLPEEKPVVRPQPFQGPFVFRPEISTQGAIAGAEIIGQPDWSGEQDLLASVAENRIRFLIEVNERGRLTSCLPWAGIETVFDATMAQKIEAEVKFAPTGQLRHGWLEVRW
jgi:hypothetical protein